MVSVSTGAAVYSLTATAMTVGLVAALHVVEPEFDPSWRMLMSGRIRPCIDDAWAGAAGWIGGWVGRGTGVS